VLAVNLARGAELTTGRSLSGFLLLREDSRDRLHSRNKRSVKLPNLRDCQLRWTKLHRRVLLLSQRDSNRSEQRLFRLLRRGTIPILCAARL